MPSPDDRLAERPPELDDLRRSLPPGDLLEERVVQELRRTRLLRPSDPPEHVSVREAGTRDGRVRHRALAAAWAVAATAAGLALFLGGYAAGQRHGAAAAADVYAELRQADARERAALVQRTGSLWVEALTALADARVASGDPAAVGAGREAARAGLLAAARELVRLEPEDGSMARVLAALEGDEAPSGPGTDRTILWF